MRLQSLRQQTPALDKSMTTRWKRTIITFAPTPSTTRCRVNRMQINAAKSARTDATPVAEPMVFANATDATVQPDRPDHSRNTERPEEPIKRPPTPRSQLQQYVRPLIDRLQNADGTPKITDPRELWGFRQDVQHLVRRGTAERSRTVAFQGMLGNVLDATDNQIEAAAPGYKANLRDDYRNRFTEEIDAMDALNAERFKLFDSQNKPGNYNAVRGLMRRMI